MAEDVVVVPIVPETESEQQAKQEASLSLEELAQLEVDREAARRKQKEDAEYRQNLSLEGLDARLNDLDNRVEALEAAAQASSKASSSSSSLKAASDSTAPKSS